MKAFVKSKLMYMTFAGLFIAFSFSAYNYNVPVQKKFLNLGKKFAFKIDAVPNASKLVLINKMDDKNWENIQNLNKRRLQNECQRLRNGTIKTFSLNDLARERVRLQNFIVDDQHKAIYCYIPKVACTQWKRIFMVLTGQHHTDDLESINSIIAHYRSGLLTLSNSHFKQEDVIDRLLRYKKFLIVRHPLERLLSAFIDKFQGTDIDAKVFQKFYAPQMMKFSRNQNMSFETDGSGMKFQEFLNYLAHHDPVNYQEHWRPYFYLCHPCAIKYDFIGKFENLEADSNNILRQLVGSSNISFPSTKLSNTKNILNQMKNDIPLPLLENIKNVYNFDFRLFGYT